MVCCFLATLIRWWFQLNLLRTMNYQVGPLCALDKRLITQISYISHVQMYDRPRVRAMFKYGLANSYLLLKETSCLSLCQKKNQKPYLVVLK